MFSDISRYQELSDIITSNKQGLSLKSKTLRLLPEVPGTFRHTVEEIDRLDHLAYKYYNQPRKWWPICDANPDFMSPLALLGKEPIITSLFTLTFEGDKPPWAILLRQLSKTVGVEKASMDKNQIVPKKQILENEQSYYEWTLVINYNKINVQREALVDMIVNMGFKVEQVENIGRIGKPIVIPSDTE